MRGGFAVLAALVPLVASGAGASTAPPPVGAPAIAAVGLEAEGAWQAEKFRWQRLAEGVFAVFPDGMGSNSLVVIGSDGALIVDSQQSPAGARLLLEQLGERTTVPVTHVVHTHWHLDHSNGATAITDRYPDAVTYAHVDAAAQAEANGAEHLDRALAFWGEPGRAQREVDIEGLRELAHPAPFQADVVLSEDATISVGGREVRILAMGAGHTNGDLAVYLPQEGIMAGGDLVLPQAFSHQGDPRGHLEILRALAQLEPQTVVGGHGGTFAGTDHMVRQAHQLALFLELVDAALAEAGGIGAIDVDEFVQSVAPQAGDLLGFPEGAVRRLLVLQQ